MPRVPSVLSFFYFLRSSSKDNNFGGRGVELIKNQPVPYLQVVLYVRLVYYVVSLISCLFS